MKKRISILLLILFEVIFLITSIGCNPDIFKPSDPNDKPPVTTDERETVDGKLSLSTRGVWHRPNCMGNETDIQGIRSVLDTFADAGVNLVFLESFYHGMAMYRSQYVPYYKGFSSYGYGEYGDYLTAFVAEAKKRDIQVHAWVEDFYVGVNDNYFTKYTPDWLLVDSQGQVRQSEGNGYLFLDPSNAEVRAYLIRIYREMLSAVPDLSGINLDYIRYPLSSVNDDTGFTDTAIKQFCEEHGLSFEGGNVREQFALRVKSGDLYSKWVAFRAGCVTQFVKEVSQAVRAEFPSAVVSTAVFPDAESTYNTKKQDFTTWIKQGYIDVVTPMAYYDDNAALQSALKQMLAGCDGCYCYAGLSAVYHSLSVDAVLKQVETCARVGADGVVFFGSQYLLDNQAYLSALAKADKSVKYVVAHDKALLTVNATVQSIEVKLVRDSSDSAQVTELSSKLDGIKRLPPDTTASIAQLQKDLEGIGVTVSKLTEQNAASIRDELTYLNRLIKLRLQFLQRRQ